LLVVHRGSGRDFTKDHHHASLATCFTSDTGHFVTGNAGIQHSIRDLITELI